jgi:hypothetical protein
MIELTEYQWEITHCRLFYPQFDEDHLYLIEKEIITVESGRYKWNRSLTSLGEYFKSLKCLKPVKGGIWRPIENTFGIKRGTLRHLLSKNGRGIPKGKLSADFEEILEILQPFRERIEAVKKFEQVALIIEGTDRDNPEEIIESLEEIESLLKKIVYKKNSQNNTE